MDWFLTSVLITGAAGFIGSHLAQECSARWSKVIALDAMLPTYDIATKRQNRDAVMSCPGCRFVEADLLDVNLEEMLAEVDIVFHLAAQPGVRSSWGPDFDVYTERNITATHRLLEAARKARLQRLVFASSSSVYGEAARRPTPEDAVLRPVSPYGATKALGEHLAHAYWRGFGVPIVTLRYFTVYGPRQRPDMAFHRLIEAALDGGEVTIFGDGRQTRDFTYVGDAVAGTIAAALAGEEGGVYNLGGGDAISMNGVLDLLETILERPVARTYTKRQRGDARDTAADTSRARQQLAFAARVPLEQGLRAQVAWQSTARAASSAT